MNIENAFVCDRAMSLSEYDWMMVETALLKYANDKAQLPYPTKIDLQQAKDAWALAKAIRFTEDQRNMQREWDTTEENLIGF